MASPSSDRILPERRLIKVALQGTGLSVRQVDALLRQGWRGLVSESQAEADELRDAVAVLTEQLKKN